MNSDIKNFWLSVRHHITEHREKAGIIAASYETATKKIEENYKPEKAEAKLEAARNSATLDMKNAADECYYALISTAADLKNELVTWEITMPPKAVLDALSFYKTYEIEPSETDLTSLLEKSQGNFLAFRAISVMADDAGFIIKNMPDAADLREDIETIATAAEMIAFDVPGVTAKTFEILPKTAPNGLTVDAVTTSTALATIDALLSRIDETAAKWANSVTNSNAKLIAKVESGEITDTETLEEEAPVTAENIKPTRKNPFENPAAHRAGVSPAEAKKIVDSYLP